MKIIIYTDLTGQRQSGLQTAVQATVNSYMQKLFGTNHPCSIYCQRESEFEFAVDVPEEKAITNTVTSEADVISAAKVLSNANTRKRNRKV